MKKLIKILLLSTVSFTLQAAVGDTFVSDGIHYRVTAEDENARTVEVSRNKGIGCAVKIPQSVIYGTEEYVVTAIGNEAFLNCSRLTSIDLPASVRTIGYRAFNGCIDLLIIILRPTSPPNFIKDPEKETDRIFQYVPPSAVLYVPSGSLRAYRNAREWKRFASIQPL